MRGNLYNPIIHMVKNIVCLISVKPKRKKFHLMSPIFQDGNYTFFFESLIHEVKEYSLVKCNLQTSLRNSGKS
jgi:hypothetical protein